MSKQAAFIEVENILIKRSLIQSIQICENYYGIKYLILTYYNGQEIKSYQTKTYSDDHIEKMYKEIKEILK